ncbi:MAG: barstar family protein [Smithellaceae bacterium]|jgi:ribonuclease inhibitor|nr:barstar family protein [Smithellaceae bacterium]
MPLKRCTLDGRTIQSLDAFYDRLAKRLNFPAHFGRSLDALWDVLATDVPGPFEIIWTSADASKKSLGRDYSKVVKLLGKLEKERDDFRLVLLP